MAAVIGAAIFALPRHNIYMKAADMKAADIKAADMRAAELKAADLQAHLHSLEERLFHPDREPNRAALGLLIADEFKEFCSSGRIVDKQQTMDVLLTSTPRPATIHHFYVRKLDENVALATYNATTPAAVSHRSSIWILRDNRWQMLFHQGTVAT
jgi:hypothetical protein